VSAAYPEKESTNRLFRPLVPTLFQSFFDYWAKMLQTARDISSDSRKETGSKTDS
jgi:hypothetical protein